MEEDIFKTNSDIEELQRQVNELKESLNGLNPRNLAGLNSFSIYDAAFPNVNDGSDGDLNISSGTTTLDLGGVSTFVKNYASINIASGATLTFSNPANNGTIIIIRKEEISKSKKLTCSFQTKISQKNSSEKAIENKKIKKNKTPKPFLKIFNHIKSSSDFCFISFK